MKTLYFVFKEIKYNILQFFCYALILALLFAVTGVTAFYCVELNGNYYGPLQEQQNFYLKLDKDADIDGIDVSGVYVFATQKGITYDVVLKSAAKECGVSDYDGGIAVRMDDGTVRLADVAVKKGEGFSKGGGKIWLSEQTAKSLGADAGDYVQIVADDGVREYKVQGIFDGEALGKVWGYNHSPSFVTDISGQNFDGYTAIVRQVGDLAQMADYLDYSEAENRDYADYIKGLDALKGVFAFLTALLSISAAAVLFAAIYSYVGKSRAFAARMEYSGFMRRRFAVTAGGIFSVIAAAACVLSLLPLFWFDRLIRHWAYSILASQFAALPFGAVFACVLSAALVLVWCGAAVFTAVVCKKKEESNI